MISPPARKTVWPKQPRRIVPGPVCVTTLTFIPTHSRIVFRRSRCWLEIDKAARPVGWSIDSHFRHGSKFARPPTYEAFANGHFRTVAVCCTRRGVTAGFFCFRPVLIRGGPGRHSRCFAF